jgi:glycosyltransferase involved in cell wall biosynthesis
MRVLRVYHGGRDPQHRGRDRALVAAGVDVTLVLPSAWPDEGAESQLSTEPFAVMALPVRRAGDVNRHSPLDVGAVERILTDSRPDVLDIHEEPFSDAARLWLRAARGRMPVVMYTAQNIDKRFPPPFGAYEHAAHRRVAAFYPCTNQAASVLRGKGFTGTINVLPLGYDDSMLVPGSQSLNVDDIILMLVGRLVREKGVEDAIRTLAHVHAMRPTRLVVRRSGPERSRRRLALTIASISWVGGRLRSWPRITARRTSCSCRVDRRRRGWSSSVA